MSKYLMKIVQFLFPAYFFSMCPAVLAQWSNNPAENLQVSLSGRSPKIMSDGDGGAYIAYWDTILVVQRLNKYGYFQFPEHGIQVGSAGYIQTTNFYLVTDGSGGVVIVYENSNVVEDKTYYKVFVQRIDSAGTKVWGEPGLDLSPEMDQSILKAACTDDQGGVCIFWMENLRNIGDGVYDFRMQRVNAQGDLLFGDDGILISAYTTGIPHHPDVREMYAAHNESGTFVFYSEMADTAENLEMQRISDVGELLWGDGIDIGFSGNMIDDGFGGVVMCGMPLQGGVFRYVRAQRIDENGNPLWDLVLDGPLDTPAGGHAGYVGISTDGNGNYVFLWNSGLDINVDILARMINKEGELQWGMTIGEPEIPGRNDLEMNGTVIISDKNMNTIIAWRARQREDGIRAQMFRNDGLRQWDKEGIILTATDSLPPHIDRLPPQVTTDMSDGAIICWAEEGSKRVSLGIYAQQISKNGKLGEIISFIRDDKNAPSVPNDYVLYQSYPNPFNASTRIRYQIPEYTHIGITIYTISGKEVVRLVNEKQSAGEYFIDWDGKDQYGHAIASGVYLYRLKTGEISEAKKMVLIK